MGSDPTPTSDGHYICEMAYNMENYFFALHSTGKLGPLNPAAHTESRVLTLPICNQTIDLVEQYKSDLDSLATRLRLNYKSGKLSIKGFHLDNDGK